MVLQSRLCSLCAQYDLIRSRTRFERELTGDLFTLFVLSALIHTRTNCVLFQYLFSTVARSDSVQVLSPGRLKYAAPAYY